MPRVAAKIQLRGREARVLRHLFVDHVAARRRDRNVEAGIVIAVQQRAERRAGRERHERLRRGRFDARHLRAHAEIGSAEMFAVGERQRAVFRLRHREIELLLEIRSAGIGRRDQRELASSRAACRNRAITAAISALPALAENA